jgi:hypothetical protein
MPSKPSSQEINQVTTSIAMTAMMAPDGFGWVKSPYVLLKNPNAPISPFDMPEYFFGGISGKFKSQIIDLGMLAMAILMFLVVIAVLISYPVI